ncbi:hypothetical protein AB1Y20_019361 [Prymnesium parvum]|uniref:Lipocalin-like domain-containing protein n=1 Tax=Prymnesium parvum TaxID=97485 RepID=A0AB34JTX0_PRYPA
MATALTLPPKTDVAKLESHAPFLGTWYLTAMYSQSEAGVRTYPLGINATGQIMYTADGHMGVYISSQHQDQTDDLVVPSPAIENSCGTVGFLETDKLIVRDRDFIAYGGTFDVDAVSGVISHRVYHSIIAAVVGADLVRNYAFGKDSSGKDTLELSSTIDGVKHGLAFVRATPH